MRHRLRAGLLCLAALLGLLSIPSARAGILDELRGTWAATPSGPPTMEWASTGDGFTVSWAPPGAEATTVQFTPTARAAVYGGKSKAGWSMMDSMFGDDDHANPLAGDMLFWARAASDAVFLYRLVIDDQGGFEIDRYTCRLEGGSLAVNLRRRTSSGMDEPADQLLVRTAK